MLTNPEIARYGRQMLLPEIGRPGQEKLKDAKVLVVGSGGLGAPVMIYLATAGIGTIGVVDYDVVDISNLHRQVIHTQSSVGASKTSSAANAMKSLNSEVITVEHNLLLDASNAIGVLRNYDVVVDCSDNVATRYLLNDACVLLKKPLISGSALRMEGQLTVYNYNDGPCYRCLFPSPPPREAVTNCDDGGVLGPITGTVGSLQALEVIKILALQTSSYVGRMLMIDGLTGEFRTARLRPRQKSCAVCGENPTITDKLVDYVLVCGSGATDKTPALKLLGDQDRVDVHRLQEHLKMAQTNGPARATVLDVRSSTQFGICNLPGTLNVPLRELDANLDRVREMAAAAQAADPGAPLMVVCRRGNDSQRAVAELRQHGIAAVDIMGGLDSWSTHVDPNFPRY